LKERETVYQYLLDYFDSSALRKIIFTFDFIFGKNSDTYTYFTLGMHSCAYFHKGGYHEICICTTVHHSDPSKITFAFG
jgi:hypothetical protein